MIAIRRYGIDVIDSQHLAETHTQLLGKYCVKQGQPHNHLAQPAFSQDHFQTGPPPSTESPIAATREQSEPVSATSAPDIAAQIQQEERTPSKKKSGVDSAATSRTVKIGLASIPVQEGHREESGWEKQFKALKLWRLENGHVSLFGFCLRTMQGNLMKSDEQPYSAMFLRGARQILGLVGG